MLDEVKRNSKLCLVFKVSHEKAYDFVSWGFLLYMLRRLSFGDRRVNWIWGCLSSSRVSVLVNGSPTSEFDLQRGLP